jgi:carbon-monoxide dehydrogenase medium subunit
MKPAPFTHHAPTTLVDALAILAAVAPQDGRVLAGGQSLVPAMAFRVARPEHLVDINRVSELDHLAAGESSLTIGALIRHAAFHYPTAPGPLGKLLAKVVRHIAHYPIRMRGTFCGSLAHADPASEWCAVAATLDAEITAQRVGGTRRIAAKDYFRGAMATALAADELLTEVRLPVLPTDTRCGFFEYSRRAGDYALGMAVVAYRVVDGKIAEPRIGIGAIEEKPRRIAAAEAILAGRAPGAEAFRAAADAVADSVDPLSDAHTSAGYRRDMSRIAVYRSLETAAA